MQRDDVRVARGAFEHLDLDAKRRRRLDVLIHCCLVDHLDGVFLAVAQARAEHDLGEAALAELVAEGEAGLRNVLARDLLHRGRPLLGRGHVNY